MRGLVTNCTRNSGLAVVRALGRAGWEVIGADDRLPRLRLHSRFASGPYRALPPEDSPGFIEALRTLVDEVRPDVLIPTRGIEAAVHNRDLLARHTHALLPSPAAFQALHDKARLMQHCAALRIPVPQPFTLPEALKLLANRRGERLVVKPCRDVGGGEGVHFVSDPDSLAAAHEQVAGAHGEALISDYVPGPIANLRALHLLFDRDSRLIAFFVLQKARIWPAQVGVTVAAVSTHEIALVEALLPLFERLGWQGPADAELKIDARDGVPRVLEINPRFSGAIQFPIGCGVDFPALYCRAALGERLESSLRPAYRAGVRYVDRGPWLASVGSELRARGARTQVLRRAREELRAPQVPSVHSLADPGALLAKWLTRGAHPRAHRASRGDA